MKEAFWGALIIILGLFGIVVVNIFQNVTVDNDRVYYLIKESTEAAALDALDLTYYRLTGDLRIVEDKFAENLTRRFAENVTIGDYTIIVEDINEMPPKISLRVRSGITSLNGEEFGIVNRVDAILETKYSLEEVLTFLDITQEEWIEYSGDTKIEVDAETGENVCKAQDINQEMECITGDLMFIGFEDVTLQNAVCQDESAPTNVVRKAKYKTCECGKWIDASENVVANPVKVGNEHVYTWNFSKTSEVRTITGSIKGRVSIEECTIGIGVLVPNDLGEVNQDTVTSEGNKIVLPYSPDNSKYALCPAEGIRIPVGMSFVAKPDYNPKTSVNRYVDWSSSDDTILTVSYNGISREGKTSEQIENAIKNHPISTCALNKEGTNCLLTSIVTAKNVGTTYINVETTRGQTATCKVEVFDGNISDLSCKNLQLSVGKSDIIQYDYNPKNAKIVGIEYSISDEKIAKIDGNTITAEAGGSATISVKEIGSGKIGTCTITVEKPPSPPDKIDGGGTGSSNPSGYYKVVDAGGNITYHPSLEEAEEAARNAATGEGFAEIFYKSSSTNDKEIKYSETEIVEDYGNGEGEYEIKIYNGSSTPVAESNVTINDNGTFIYVWDLDGNLISKEIIENPNKNTSNNSGGSNKKPTTTLEDVKDKPTGQLQQL